MHDIQLPGQALAQSSSSCADHLVPGLEQFSMTLSIRAYLTGKTLISVELSCFHALFKSTFSWINAIIWLSVIVREVL